MAYLSADTRHILEPLKDEIVPLFSEGDWMALGVATDCLDIIEQHPRLFRSKHFGDPDYPDCVFDVLIQIAKRDEKNLSFVTRRINKARGSIGQNISSLQIPAAPVLVFSPTVFSIPEVKPNQDLISVMMPFDAGLTPVMEAIKKAAFSNNLICKRGDDIWHNSVVVQDIFDLIYQSYIVICDFTGRNPNVFYEAGIAHTLGKHVVPITQSVDDVPFNLRHHRFIHYLNNIEGRSELSAKLEERIGGLLDARKQAFPW